LIAVPQASAEDSQDLERYARVLAAQTIEIGLLEDPALQFRPGSDTGIARFVLEDGELPEEIARTQIANMEMLPGQLLIDLDTALEDDEQAVTVVVLAKNVGSSGEFADLQQGTEPVKGILVQSLEQRDST